MFYDVSRGPHSTETSHFLCEPHLFLWGEWVKALLEELSILGGRLQMCKRMESYSRICCVGAHNMVLGDKMCSWRDMVNAV